MSNIDDLCNVGVRLCEHISGMLEAPCEDEVRCWLIAASLRIWSANKLYAESYRQAINAIATEEYSSAQVITALDCAGGDDRALQVPSFFKQIVEDDVRNRSRQSAKLIGNIGHFLAMMALINGDFTLDEANALQRIMDLLQDYCKEKGIETGKRLKFQSSAITPMSKTGYHQPAQEEEAIPARQDSVHPQNADLPTIAPEESPDHPSKDFSSRNPSITENTDEETKENIGVSVSRPNEMTQQEDTLESVLAELKGLVGLDKVKQDVENLMSFIQICRMRIDRGMKVPTVSYHLVFTGNPGTGKTTVARMVAKLYYLMGILPSGQLVETDRSGLVAGYLGQTAIKTQKVIKEALGGVLFIDEAYSLANDKEDSYGKEAIETILKAMEDHRDELVVIVAGYDELMHKFIDSNPGLRSRFNKYFHFPDYDGEDLLRILERFCDTNGYVLAKDTIPVLKEKLDSVYANREEHFGNARSVRNLFEHAINLQASRLIKDSDITDEELATLVLEDILPALEVL